MESEWEGSPGQRSFRGLSGSLIILFVIIVFRLSLPLLSFGRGRVLIWVRKAGSQSGNFPNFSPNLGALSTSFLHRLNFWQTVNWWRNWLLIKITINWHHHEAEAKDQSNPKLSGHLRTFGFLYHWQSSTQADDTTTHKWRKAEIFQL